MLDNATLGVSSLRMRPALAADGPFLEQLYRTSRPDLQHIDGSPEQIETVLALQFRALQVGAGTNYPNAMHLVAERLGDRIGGVIVDFGPNEVRLVFLALLPEARNKGYGQQLLRGLQEAASRVHAPLAVTVWRNNPKAKRLYLSMGFVVEESEPLAERLVWYPDARPMIVVP